MSTSLRITAAAGILLGALACGRKGAPEGGGRAPATPASPGRTEVLATIPAGTAPPAGVPGSSYGFHGAVQPGEIELHFGERGGVAYAVGSGEKTRIVHGEQAGKAYDAVGAIALSPDGRRCAYGALAGGRWRMVVDGVEGRAYDTVKSPVFSPDGAHLAYQAMAGDRWYLVVDGTANAGTKTRILKHAFGADSSRVVYVDDADGAGGGRLVVSDLSFGRVTMVASGVTELQLSAAGSTVAAIVVRGGASVLLALDPARPERVVEGPAFEAIERVAPADGADGVAYVGLRAGSRFVVRGKEEESLGFGSVVGPLVVRPGGNGVGALVSANGTAFVREYFAPQGPREGVYEEAEGLAYDRTGRSHAYAARRGQDWFVVVNGKEGPRFDRVVTPRFTPDGKQVVYRARDQGRRFVVFAGLDARTVKRGPLFDQVFPVSISPAGAVGYGVKDGPRLAWRVEDP